MLRFLACLAKRGLRNNAPIEAIAMAKHIRCGKLFNGLEDDARIDQTIVVDDASITFVGPSAEAPKCTEDDTTVDHSQYFVMPGLIDIHVHLAYGNSKCSEDTDLYAPLEFRALRGLINAQRVLNAGYTSMADPGTSGRVTLAIRDAINAGLFVGPRIITSGPYISSRQGLTDWYPSWFGNPSTAIARVVHDMTKRSKRSVSKSKTVSISSSWQWTVANSTQRAKSSLPLIRPKPQRWSTKPIAWARRSRPTPAAVRPFSIRLAQEWT